MTTGFAISQLIINAILLVALIYCFKSMRAGREVMSSLLNKYNKLVEEFITLQRELIEYNAFVKQLIQDNDQFNNKLQELIDKAKNKTTEPSEEPVAPVVNFKSQSTVQQYTIDDYKMMDLAKLRHIMIGYCFQSKYRDQLLTYFDMDDTYAGVCDDKSSYTDRFMTGLDQVYKKFGDTFDLVKLLTANEIPVIVYYNIVKTQILTPINMSDSFRLISQLDMIMQHPEAIEMISSRFIEEYHILRDKDPYGIYLMDQLIINHEVILEKGGN